MNIKTASKSDYKFHNPEDTVKILYDEILKKEQWETNRRTNKEEKKDWWYESKSKFEKNINLLFSKFIPLTSLRDEEKENKDKYLQFIINEFENLKTRLNNFNFIKERNEELINKLKDSGLKAKSFQATCQWRIIIGLGASHPQETSMTLHHIYGIPYIPGSAIKGITKHWVVLKIADHISTNENKNFEDAVEKVSEALEEGRDYNISLDGIEFRDLVKIFGTQKQIGQVIFIDAYPIDKINLEIDIMNVHYPDYYSGKEPPTDYQKPRPIKFLTVKGTKFQFHLLSQDINLLNHTEKILKEALKEHGIGAKTSLGYGIFDL